jgi:hypothetical protein
MSAAVRDWRSAFAAALPLAAIYPLIVNIKDAPVLGPNFLLAYVLLDSVASEVVLGVFLAAGVALVETRESTQRGRIAGYVIVTGVSIVAVQVMWEGVMAVLGLLHEYKSPFWARFWGNAGAMLVESLFAIALYRMWRRARERAAALRDLQRTRAELLRHTAQADLLAMQARIDPTFLFETLRDIDHAYGVEASRGRRLIDALIDYLRAALPGIDGTTSTLGKECDLARAYLDLARERHRLDLAVSVDLKRESRATPFPPMLVLPLLDDIVRSLRAIERAGRITITPAVAGGVITLAIDVEPPCLPSSATLTLVRGRLRDLFADAGAITLRDTRILLEVPHAAYAGPDR